MNRCLHGICALTATAIALMAVPVCGQNSQRSVQVGPIRETRRPLPLEIAGDGFFQVTTADGLIRYTRDGAFTWNADGDLVLPRATRNCPVEPPVIIPRRTLKISVGGDGLVTVTLPRTRESLRVGRIQLARFANPAGLRPLGENLFAATVASGPPRINSPGVQGAGVIRVRTLANSNVEAENDIQLRNKTSTRQTHSLCAVQGGPVHSRSHSPGHSLVKVANCPCGPFNKRQSPIDNHQSGLRPTS
jgi:flagellar basal body rod protein FlgG